MLYLLILFQAQRTFWYNQQFPPWPTTKHSCGYLLYLFSRRHFTVAELNILIAFVLD